MHFTNMSTLLETKHSSYCHFKLPLNKNHITVQPTHPNSVVLKLCQYSGMLTKFYLSEFLPKGWCFRLTDFVYRAALVHW